MLMDGIYIPNIIKQIIKLSLHLLSKSKGGCHTD